MIAYGSGEKLEKQETAATEYTVYRNLNATSQLPININSVEGVKFSPSRVEIYINIEE